MISFKPGARYFGNNFQILQGISIIAIHGLSSQTAKEANILSLSSLCIGVSSLFKNSWPHQQY